jgi:hypothetical protein
MTEVSCRVCKTAIGWNERVMFRKDPVTGRNIFQHAHDCIASRIKHRILLIGPGADDPEKVKRSWPY